MAERKTLFRDLLSFLKEDLSTNIVDPISGRGKTSKFVMTTFPEREVKYPLITLEIVDTEEVRAGMQTTAMDILLTVDVTIYSKSITQADKLTQEVMDRLADIQFVDNTGSIDNDFHDFQIVSCIPTNFPGKGGIKSRTIQLNYKFYNL